MPIKKCISEVSNTQADNAKDNDVVVPMHNLIRYSDIYWITSVNLWQYYSDEPTLSSAGSIIDLPSNNNNNNNINNNDNNNRNNNNNNNNNIVSFKSKEKITGQADSNGTQDVEIIVPLK